MLVQLEAGLAGGRVRRWSWGHIGEWNYDLRVGGVAADAASTCCGQEQLHTEGTRRNSARHLDQGARWGEPAAEAAAEAAEAAT